MAVLMSERRPTEDRILTFDEVMEQLRISRNSLVMLIRQGKIKHQRIGAMYRFRQSWIDRFLEGETEEEGRQTPADE